MAQINMNGKQSFLLNDIKNHIRGGGNVTHILNVKVSNQRSSEEGNRIRQKIYSRIANAPQTKTVMGLTFAITWRTSATTTSAYYHCDMGGLLGDVAVKAHSEALLSDILRAIDAEFGQVFSQGITGVAFLVTKPLVREVALIDGAVPSFACASPNEELSITGGSPVEVLSITGGSPDEEMDDTVENF